MKHPSKWLARKLPLVVVLAVLALLRAEQGVQEMKGTADSPSRILHVAPDPGSQIWSLTLVGHQIRIPSPTALAESEELRNLGQEVYSRIKNALQ